MMGKAMKRVVLFIFGILILSMFIFHHAFLTFLMTWSLQAYSVSKWGKPLQYEKLSLIGNQLIIFQPRFENEPSFTAERMTLNFHFNFWKRHLHIDIEIERPHWHFQAPVSSQW